MKITKEELIKIMKYPNTFEEAADKIIKVHNAELKTQSGRAGSYVFACGQNFYRIIGTTVHHYEYLCVHPHNGHYHILLNRSTEEPERFYTTKMNELIDDKTKAYEILKQKLLNRAEIIQERYLSKQ